jgi:hypothetical protein
MEQLASSQLRKRIKPRGLHQKIDWSPVKAALDHAQSLKRTIDIWWRDDDAIMPSPQLEHLLSLAQQMRMPIALACIPKNCRQSLAERLKTETHIDALVHGYTHTNYAPAGEKKIEFGAHRPVNICLQDAHSGLMELQAIFGSSLLPVFVPPWNRIDDEITAHLAELGYCGLSTFNTRSAPYGAVNLMQINTHIDPIAWHAGGSLVSAQALVDLTAKNIETRLVQPPQMAEPIGLLTHHLVHDEAIWDFCTQWIDVLGEHPAVKKQSARYLFSQNVEHFKTWELYT